jgi:hypothetical protein
LLELAPRHLEGDEEKIASFDRHLVGSMAERRRPAS